MQAKQQALYLQLARERQETVKTIEKAISTVEALRLDDNAPQGDRVVNELCLVLQEVHRLNPLQVPDPEIFSELAERIQRALVAFVFGNSAALLRRIRLR